MFSGDLTEIDDF